MVSCLMGFLEYRNVYAGQKESCFGSFHNYVCVGTLSPDELNLCHLVIQHLRRVSISRNSALCRDFRPPNTKKCSSLNIRYGTSCSFSNQ
jgi:hypothetical protein